MVFDVRNAHLVGIGGIGMSGVAKMLLSRSVRVTGSDARAGEIVDELRYMGARVAVGHEAANVPPDTELVVASPAVPDANPELRGLGES